MQNNTFEQVKHDYFYYYPSANLIFQSLKHLVLLLDSMARAKSEVLLTDYKDLFPLIQLNELIINTNMYRIQSTN